jgi:hypothetical protein
LEAAFGTTVITVIDDSLARLTCSIVELEGTDETYFWEFFNAGSVKQLEIIGTPSAFLYLCAFKAVLSASLTFVSDVQELSSCAGRSFVDWSTDSISQIERNFTFGTG